SAPCSPRASSGPISSGQCSDTRNDGSPVAGSTVIASVAMAASMSAGPCCSAIDRLPDLGGAPVGVLGVGALGHDPLVQAAVGVVVAPVVDRRDDDPHDEQEHDRQA